MAADVLPMGSGGLSLRAFLLDRARLQEQFVVETLSVLERQFVGTVDDLRDFSELAEFDCCLPRLAIIKIRRALEDASCAAREAQTDGPQGAGPMGRQLLPAPVDASLSTPSSSPVSAAMERSADQFATPPPVEGGAADLRPSGPSAAVERLVPAQANPATAQHAVVDTELPSVQAHVGPRGPPPAAALPAASRSSPCTGSRARSKPRTGGTPIPSSHT